MPHTILSVDGDAALRFARNQILHNAGFEVVEAGNGPDSLNLAFRNQPALIVLPIELPGMDGLEVCRRLKADPRTAPIPVLHIARAGQPYRGYPESLESGANAWLQEPLDPPVLIAVAAALIRTRSTPANSSALRESQMDAPTLTERKRADEERRRLAGELADRVGELQAILDAAPVAIWIAHDPQCLRITGNAFADRVVTQSEPGGNSSQSAPSGDAIVVFKVFRGGVELPPAELPAQVAAATGRPVKQEEIDMVFPGGRTVNMLLGAMPLFDAEGRVRGSVVAGADVTETKRAEEALRESEAVLRSFFDSPGAMRGFVEQIDGRIVHVSCNAAAAEMYGVDRESIAGKSLTDAGASAEVVRIWEGFYEQSRRTGKPVSGEYARRDAEGRERWLLASASYLGTGHSGNPRFAYTVSDLTERQRAERDRERLAAQLARERELLHTVLETTPVGINLVRGSDLTYEWINSAYQNIAFGKEMLGHTLQEAWPEIYPELVDLYRRVLETGEPHQAVDQQFQIRRSPSGSLEPRYFTWTLVRARLPGEQGWGVLNTAIETTGRVRAEQRLRDSQKLESLGLLAGGVAHDFNNLLVGVIGGASLAQEMLPPSHPAIELIEGIVRAGEQAAHLTRQMLAYSGKGKFLVEPVNLSALIPEMSGLVRRSISKKIALCLDLAEDLPPIEADRGQIQQVFMNLALNAAEAIGSREGRIDVRTCVEDVDARFMRLHPEAAELRPGKYVCLEVRDTGCGMDDDTRTKIFDPFFSTKFTGRGLGLAAVAGIVRGHQAAIMVTSQPGKGACFTVLFPAAAGAAEAPPAAVRDAALQGSGVILVVDDEPLVLNTAKIALEHRGYTVLLADSGPEAIDILKRYPGEIALVVLDLSMPRMSGEEALPELRKIRPSVKALVSSGYSEAETLTMFQGQRVSGFIQKPYTSKGIAEKVKDCLR
jgi:PAS domain S-box-containing protein